MVVMLHDAPLRLIVYPCSENSNITPIPPSACPKSLQAWTAVRESAQSRIVMMRFHCLVVIPSHPPKARREVMLGKRDLAR